MCLIFWPRVIGIKKKKQPRNRLLYKLTGLPEEIIQTIKQHLKAGGGPLISSEKLEINNGRDHGLVSAYWGLGDRLGLWEILSKYLDGQLHRVIGMVINRLGDPKAKYSLRDWLVTTSLCGILNKDIGHFHYNRCYEALDAVNKYQIKIEDELQKTNRGKKRLVLYDLTSSYFEGGGENEALIKYGYNRDKKKGKKQIVIGLVTDEQGLPMSVEVLPGNTQDKSVLKERIENLKQRFHVEEVILVFDRGMATSPNKQALKGQGIDYITAMKPSEIKKLIKDGKNEKLQLGLFDKKDLLELQINTAPKGEEPYYERLILCRSEAKQVRDEKQYQRLMEKTEEKLKQIESSIAKGRLKDKVKIAKRVGKWINKWKCEQYFDTDIDTAKFNFNRNKVKIETQELLYGMYVLSTSNGAAKEEEKVQKELTTESEPENNKPQNQQELENKNVHIPKESQPGQEENHQPPLTAEQVRESYQSLNNVENEFRILKSSLEVRPMRHWKTSRIKGHVFVCFLALWLQWHFEDRLKPLWKTADKSKDQDKYTRSQVEAELLQLKSIKLLPEEIFTQPILTTQTKLQKQIFKHLQVTITPPPSH